MSRDQEMYEDIDSMVHASSISKNSLKRLVPYIVRIEEYSGVEAKLYEDEEEFSTGCYLRNGDKFCVHIICVGSLCMGFFSFGKRFSTHFNLKTPEEFENYIKNYFSTNLNKS